MFKHVASERRDDTQKENDMLDKTLAHEDGGTDIESIDALLDGLTVDEVAEPEVETTVEPEVHAETDTGVAVGAEAIDVEAAAEAALNLELMKEDSYAEAATDEIADPAAVETAKETKAAEKAAKAPKTPSEPKVRVARDLKDLPADAFVLTTDVPADLEANKTAVIAKRPAQVKIAEKFDNVLTSIAAGKEPSTYVMDCFRLLNKAEGGEISSKDLVAGLRQPGMRTETEGYSEGTARSQVGQIMALFDVLQIAKRTGDRLKLNEDSTLVQALREKIAA